MVSLDAQIAAAEDAWIEGFVAGPTVVRWHERPLQIGDAAPDGMLPDETDTQRRLSDHWAQRPALVLFWRQFGCSCGAGRAERLHEEHDAYVSAGADVVIVGMGEPQRAAAYKQRYDVPCTILCDPARDLYTAYGLLQGTPAQVLFDAPDEFLRLERDAGTGLQAARRADGRPPVDDPWLLPSEFVVGTDGRIVLAYRYQYCEGYPDPRVHIAAIREAGGELGQRPWAATT